MAILKGIQEDSAQVSSLNDAEVYNGILESSKNEYKNKKCGVFKSYKNGLEVINASTSIRLRSGKGIIMGRTFENSSDITLDLVGDGTFFVVCTYDEKKPLLEKFSAGLKTKLVKNDILNNGKVFDMELAKVVVSSGNITSFKKIDVVDINENTNLKLDDIYTKEESNAKHRSKATFDMIGFDDSKLSPMNNDEVDSYICGLVSSYTGNKTHGFALVDLVGSRYPNLHNYLKKISGIDTSNISYYCEFTTSVSSPRYIKISGESGSYLSTREFEGNNWSSKRVRPYSFYGGEIHGSKVYGQDSSGNEILLNNPDNSFFTIMKTGETLSIPLGSREKFDVYMYAPQYYDNAPFSVEVRDSGNVLIQQDVGKTGEVIQTSAPGGFHEYYSDFPNSSVLTFTCKGMYRGEIHLSVSKISQARTEIIARVYGKSLEVGNENDVVGAVYRSICSNVSDFLNISCVTNEVASGEGPINGYVYVNDLTWYRDGETAVQPNKFSSGLKIGKVENLEVIQAEDLRQQQNHEEQIAKIERKIEALNFAERLKNANIDVYKLKKLLEGEN